MPLLIVLVSGLVAGVVAQLIVSERKPSGWMTSIVLGVLGSLIGGYVGRSFGLYAEGQPAAVLMSVAGAVLLLLGYHVFIKARLPA